MELEALGIAGDQEAVYRHLVAGGPASAAELSERVLVRDSRTDGGTGDAIGAVLASMLEAGLVLREDGRFRASPPELALRSLLARRRGELSRAEDALAELTELFRVSASGSVQDLIEVLAGADAVRQRFTQLQRGASSTVRAFVRADPVVVRPDENPAEAEAVRRGVRYRVLMERAMLQTPGTLAQVEESVAAGEEVRSMDQLPLRMLVADDEMALVPLASSGEPGAVLVRRSGLLDALIALFEQSWVRAVPVVAERPDGEDELDSRIISVLLQGYGDHSIASQLAVSPRTVQRRVRALMNQADAVNRVQLGHWLGRNGFGVPDA